MSTGNNSSAGGCCVGLDDALESTASMGLKMPSFTVGTSVAMVTTKASKHFSKYGSIRVG